MTTRFFLKTLILTLLTFLQIPSFAKTFRNAYLSFELPDSWSCRLESTEWICRSENPKDSKEAIIIFTAKEVGPADTLSIYEQTINAPRTVLDKTGKPITSTVSMSAKSSKINDQTWVDGMQKGSEIPNYFTRYVATIKDKIAILVTFSAHADFFAKYSTDFFKAIQSMRVVASKNLLARTNGSAGNANGSGVWGAASSTPGGFSMDGETPFGQKRGKGGKNNLRLLLITIGALLVAAGVYFAMNSKKR